MSIADDIRVRQDFGDEGYVFEKEAKPKLPHPIRPKTRFMFKPEDYPNDDFEFPEDMTDDAPTGILDALRRGHLQDQAGFDKAMEDKEADANPSRTLLDRFFPIQIANQKPTRIHIRAGYAPRRFTNPELEELTNHDLADGFREMLDALPSVCLHPRPPKYWEGKEAPDDWLDPDREIGDD